MGESGPRRMEDMPAAGIEGRKAAVLLFLAATFGLMALLSVPISRILPLSLRLPRAIQQALSPFDPTLPPFLRDVPRQNSYHSTSPRITAAGGSVSLFGTAPAPSPSPSAGASAIVRPPASSLSGRGDSKALNPSKPARQEPVNERHGHGDGLDHKRGEKEKGKDAGQKTKKPKPDKK